MHKGVIAVIGVLVLSTGFYLALPKMKKEPVRASQVPVERPPGEAPEQATPAAPPIPVTGNAAESGPAADDAELLDDQPPVVEPEFERMLRNKREGVNYSLVRALHEEFSRETRNEDWAAATEGRLNTFYAGKPDVLQYGSPVVACRTTLCEVRLLTAVPWQGESNGFRTMTNPSPGEPPHGLIPRAVARDLLDDGTNVVVAIFQLPDPKWLRRMNEGAR